MGTKRSNHFTAFGNEGDAIARPWPHRLREGGPSRGDDSFSSGQHSGLPMAESELPSSSIVWRQNLPRVPWEVALGGPSRNTIQHQDRTTRISKRADLECKMPTFPMNGREILTAVTMMRRIRLTRSWSAAEARRTGEGRQSSECALKRVCRISRFLTQFSYTSSAEFA